MKNCISEVLEKRSFISSGELEQILKLAENADFRKDAVLAIEKQLETPSFNSLVLAYHIPDKKYERKLLLSEPEDNKAIVYWMLALGRIKSVNAFCRIQRFTETRLFNQAYAALAMINSDKTAELFEPFLDKRFIFYNATPASRHSSGFNALVNIFRFSGKTPEEVVSGYDLSNEKKKALVLDCIAYFKERKPALS